MLDLTKVTGFEWDQGNEDKSYRKHGITPKETEETFLDENVLFQEDFQHSQTENRQVVIGNTIGGKLLFAVFTVRRTKIRIISVRKANRKERKRYEEKT